MTRYIIDQQTHDEIAARHAQFWRSHRAEPLGCCKDCKHCGEISGFIDCYAHVRDDCDENVPFETEHDNYCSWFEKKGKE